MEIPRIMNYPQPDYESLMDRLSDIDAESKMDGGFAEVIDAAQPGSSVTREIVQQLLSDEAAERLRAPILAMPDTAAIGRAIGNGDTSILDKAITASTAQMFEIGIALRLNDLHGDCRAVLAKGLEQERAAREWFRDKASAMRAGERREAA